MPQNPFVLGADAIYRCPLLQQFDWLRHGFGTRRANPIAEITLRQLHSDRVLNAGGLADREADGDALVTDQRARAIGVRTADCVPLLFVDARTRAIAAVHAGWRGTAAAIAQRALQKMASDFGTLPEDLYVAIGPCIRKCCYEVGPEVFERFRSIFPESSLAGGSRKVDLPEANRRQLQSAGVPPGHIADCYFCTSCHLEEFFSYRREPDDPGRLIASITRTE